jgi:Flp pilus assembly CpaE family ATPase
MAEYRYGGLEPCTLSNTALRILLIEDNPGDAELVKEALADAGECTFQVYCVEALLPGLDRLARGDIDLVLLDMSLPDSHGLDGLNTIRTHEPDVPVVVLTGLDNESLALRAVQSGAQEYLVKGTLHGPALARTLQHAIVRQRMQAESSRLDPRPDEAKVVGFLGAKGGVGSTTIACHIGMELKKQTNGRVLVMDFDLAGNSAGFLLNVNAPYGILEASNDILHLDENRWKKLVASGAGSLDVMQSGGPVTHEENLAKAERVRFVLRFVRSLYQWIVVDLGRLNPFSAKLAEEVSSLYLVSTCDILGLSEAKSAINKLFQAGFDRDSLALILNQTPARTGFPRQELEKLLGAPVKAMLPECYQDFADHALEGERLGQSRKFQKHVALLAASIAGVEKEAQTRKTLFSFLPGGLRSAATTT